MKVTVTREDIAIGQRDSIVSCPIARALKRSLAKLVTDQGMPPMLIDVRVWATFWYVPGGPRASLPASAQQFINDFDLGRPVTPFSFTIPSQRKETDHA